jgi:hypothetical protein
MSRQPIWRLYIFSRALAKYTGLLHLFALLTYPMRAARRRWVPAEIVRESPPATR